MATKTTDGRNLRASILAIVLLLPLCACDQPQGSGSSSQQRATGTPPRSGGSANTAETSTAQQPGEVPRIGPRGNAMAGTQPQPATGTVPNDASGPMAAPNSLNSGVSDRQPKKESAPQDR